MLIISPFTIFSHFNFLRLFTSSSKGNGLLKNFECTMLLRYCIGHAGPSGAGGLTLPSVFNLWSCNGQSSIVLATTTTWHYWRHFNINRSAMASFSLFANSEPVQKVNRLVSSPMKGSNRVIPDKKPSLPTSQLLTLHRSLANQSTAAFHNSLSQRSIETGPRISRQKLESPFYWSGLQQFIIRKTLRLTKRPFGGWWLADFVLLSKESVVSIRYCFQQPGRCTQAQGWTKQHLSPTKNPQFFRNFCRMDHW